MTPSDGNVDGCPAGAIQNSSVNLGEAIAEEDEENEEEKGDKPGASDASVAAAAAELAAPHDVLMTGVEAEPVQPLVNAGPDSEDKEKQEDPAADAAALPGDVADVHGPDGSSQSALPAQPAAEAAASTEEALASESADGKQAQQQPLAADAGTEAKPKKAAKAVAGTSAKRRRTE